MAELSSVMSVPIKQAFIFSPFAALRKLLSKDALLPMQENKIFKLPLFFNFEFSVLNCFDF
jgi:hypothetical protein